MVHDLYILMITAGIVALLFKLLKQPVVLGYIVAGVLNGMFHKINPKSFVCNFWGLLQSFLMLCY